MSGTRTVMGFDFGYSRIGIAVGQELISAARPLATLHTRRRQPDWDALARLIAQWQPELLVIGLPYHADGSPNAVTQAALNFSRQLHNRFGLPVETIDERLSSWAAERTGAEINAKPHRCGNDAVAAALILDSWFNRSPPA